MSWIADTAISRKGGLLLFHRRIGVGSDVPLRYLAFTLDTRNRTAAAAENDEKYVICRTCETIKRYAKIWKIRNICHFTSDPQLNHFHQCQGISELQRFQEERKNRFYHKLRTTGITCTDAQDLYDQYVDAMGDFMEQLNATQAAKLKSRLWQSFLKAPNSTIAEQRAPAMPAIPAELLTEDGLLIAPSRTPSRSVSPIFQVLYPPVDPDDRNHPNHPMFMQ